MVGQWSSVAWHTTKRLLQLKKSATDSKIITWHDGHKNWSVDTKKKKSNSDNGWWTADCRLKNPIFPSNTIGRWICFWGIIGQGPVCSKIHSRRQRSSKPLEDFSKARKSLFTVVYALQYSSLKNPMWRMWRKEHFLFYCLCQLIILYHNIQRPYINFFTIRTLLNKKDFWFAEDEKGWVLYHSVK